MASSRKVRSSRLNWTLFTFTGRDIGQAVALDPNHDLVVAGYGHQGGQDDFLLWRLPNTINPPQIQPTLTQVGDQATLTWPANAFYGDGYIVWRSEDPNFTLAGLWAERVAEGNINSYTIPSQDVSRPYYYTVGGLDRANHHTWSSEIFNLGVEAPPPPAAPTVTLTAPNGGETLDDDPVVVSWTADDANGDALTFHLQYSRDNGLTWELTGQNMTGNQANLDANTLGSTDNGLFRIWVTDGAETASDQSDASFSVPNRIPVVQIIEPAAQITVVQSDTITFVGSAYDVDTGPMAGDQLRWLSDLDGSLGNGAQVEVSNLSLGQHVVTFQADDGLGGVATDTVQVEVEAAHPDPDLDQQIFLPIVIR